MSSPVLSLTGTVLSQNPRIPFSRGNLVSYVRAVGNGSVTPHPDEVHSTCNCKGTYVHQVPL